MMFYRDMMIVKHPRFVECNNMSICTYVFKCTNKLTHGRVFYFLFNIIARNVLIISMMIIYNNTTNSINNNITNGNFLMIQF